MTSSAMTKPLASLRLSAVLTPMTMGEFEADYREKRPLHLPAAVGQEDIEALLSLRTFDLLVSSGRLVHPQLEIILNERPGAAPTGVRGRVSGLQVAQAIAEGASLRMRSVQDHVQAVATACATLADDLDENVDATAYYTPDGTHAFRPHFDDHDVFVVQCHGKKVWRLWEGYECDRPLPLPGERFDPSIHIPGAVAEEVTLAAGDMLYLPRGVMHAARCEQGDSLHITFSTSTTTLGDLLVGYCQALVREQLPFRRKLGHAALSRPFATGGALELLAGLGALTGIDPDLLATASGAILSKFTTSVVPARIEGAFFSQRRDCDRTPGYVYDDTVIWRVVEVADRVQLHLPEHESELTPGEYAALQAVRNCRGPIRPDELARDFPSLNADQFLADLSGIGIVRQV